ncbi:MAG: hypothetical protein VYC39_07580 [Myxococcota bacterium]|nr:hypothetical protein [Myxococcota bacterium]
MLRSKSSEGSRETREDERSNDHLTTPEAKTKHGEHGEKGRESESLTPSFDFPTIPPSLPSVPPPPLPENQSSATDDLFSDLPPPLSIESSKKTPDPSPETVPPRTDLDDLFSDLGESAESSPGIELAPPIQSKEEEPIFSNSLFMNTDQQQSTSENTSTGLEFDDSPLTGSVPPLVNDISMPVAPPSSSEAVAQTKEPNSNDGQALGKIALNQVSTNRDGTPVAPRARTLSRPRTITAEYIDDVPEPGSYLRSFATFVLVLISLLGALLFVRQSDGRALNSWSLDALNEDIKQFKVMAGYQTKPDVFQLNKLIAQSYRLGVVEREVLVVQGTVTNTATTTFESAVALVDIMHEGTSVRTKMTPIGVSLDLKALAKVQTQSELVQLKQQAKTEAYDKGKTRLPPGKPTDFIFVMWDIPPELEQSAIYVAFRAGRGTVSP